MHIFADAILLAFRDHTSLSAGGHLALYGTVANTMDKQVAGIRANQVFGAFSVQNNLEVAKKS
jgi:hypothetical protein